MVREFIRDENHQIIGTRLVIERGQYINKLEEARNNLFIIDEMLSYKYNKLLKMTTRKNKKRILGEVNNLQLNKMEIENQIEELLQAKVFNHFTENRFDVQYEGNIKLMDIMTPEQKEHQEMLSKKYNLIRINKRYNPMITLNENGYKK